jgi:Tfp pilus assembly protein PilF
MKLFIFVFVLICLVATGYSVSPPVIQVFPLQSIQMEDLQAEIKKGIRFFKNGRLQEAEKIFKEVLNQNQNVLIAKEMLGLVSVRKNDYNSAQRYAMAALSQHKRSAKAHLILAAVYNNKGNQLAARDHMRKARKYATEREKEIVKEYMTKENLDRAEQIERTSLKKKDYNFDIEPSGDKPYIAVFFCRYKW